MWELCLQWKLIRKKSSFLERDTPSVVDSTKFVLNFTNENNSNSSIYLGPAFEVYFSELIS